MKIWYVSGQRLCNFDCSYCVSTGTWAKSRKFNWQELGDAEKFAGIVRWIGSRPFPVEVRLASLGEPFTSFEFLEQAGWLTRQPNVRFVELVSNGSLVARRLPKMEAHANLGKLALWLTYHHGEIPIERFIANAKFAQEEYGCFVVVNALLFPDQVDAVRAARDAAQDAGLRFNIDLGYDPAAPSDAFEHSADASKAVPALRDFDVVQIVESLGGGAELTEAALIGLTSPAGRPCAAGSDYFFIDIDGHIYRCSRYSVLDKDRYGNVLDPDFRLPVGRDDLAPCGADSGCCNKEDFLNLNLPGATRLADVPSLGWVNGA